MRPIFSHVGMLDRRAYERYAMSEEVLMEHAALAMAEQIRKRFPRGAKVLAVCGPGNNGADGLALARLLKTAGYAPRIRLPYGAKSPLARLQLERAERLEIPFSEGLEPVEAVADCLFGSGLNRPLDPAGRKAVEAMNRLEGFKVACDVPSGLMEDGTMEAVFRADVTVTMGAAKLCLYADAAKDPAGEIVTADLGIPFDAYAVESDAYVLEAEDLELPFRTRNDVNKGSYGHLGVVAGEKAGAGVLAGSSALAFGAGLVTLVRPEPVAGAPFELMQGRAMPEKAGAVVAGMGLGNAFSPEAVLEMARGRALVLDADLFHDPSVCLFLERKEPTVLTPHPGEFAALAKHAGLSDTPPPVEAVQGDRFGWVRRFSERFPEAVLLLKGANTVIGWRGKRYVNPLGVPALAKGGSGDVLAGMIGALLAQGREPLDAAVSASLAHALAAAGWEGNDYALTPPELVRRLGAL